MLKGLRKGNIDLLKVARVAEKLNCMALDSAIVVNISPICNMSQSSYTILFRVFPHELHIFCNYAMYLQFHVMLLGSNPVSYNLK